MGSLYTGLLNERYILQNKPPSLEGVNVRKLPISQITAGKRQLRIIRDADSIFLKHIIVISPSNNFYMKSINLLVGGNIFIKVPVIHMDIEHITHRGRPAIIYRLPKIVYEYETIMIALQHHNVAVELETEGNFDTYELFCHKLFIMDHDTRLAMSRGNYETFIPQYITYPFLHFKGRQTLNLTNFCGISRGMFFRCNPDKLTYFCLSLNGRKYMELFDAQIREYSCRVNENMLYISFDCDNDFHNYKKTNTAINFSTVDVIEVTFDSNDIFHGCLSSVITNKVRYRDGMGVTEFDYPPKVGDFIPPMEEHMKRKQPIPDTVRLPQNIDRIKMNNLLNYTRREAYILKRYEIRNILGLKGK